MVPARTDYQTYHCRCTWRQPSNLYSLAPTHERRYSTVKRSLFSLNARPIATALFTLLSVPLIGIHAPLQPALADPPAEAARAVVNKNRGAVVTLSVVVKFSGGDIGGESNSDLEATGFVIDPSGLIVTTNMAIDPASSMAGMGADFGAARFTSKVVSVRIITADGQEIPGKVVLRDTDRNLAFIRPTTPLASPLPSIDLKTAGKAQIGDPVFVLGRLGKSLNRGPDLKLQRIIGVVERPRTLYVLPGDMTQSIGTAIFSENGAPLGILTMKISPVRRRSFSMSDSFMPVVIPAEDVMEVGEQAPQAKDVKEGSATSVPPKPAAPKPGAPAPGKKPASGSKP